MMTVFGCFIDGFMELAGDSTQLFRLSFRKRSVVPKAKTTSISVEVHAVAKNIRKYMLPFVTSDSSVRYLEWP